MAELFGRDGSVISRQLRTVFSSGGAKAGGNCCKKCNRSKRRINVQIEEWSVQGKLNEAHQIIRSREKLYGEAGIHDWQRSRTPSVPLLGYLRNSDALSVKRIFPMAGIGTGSCMPPSVSSPFLLTKSLSLWSLLSTRTISKYPEKGASCENCL